MPVQPPAQDSPPNDPQLDLRLEARPIDGPSKGLAWVKTLSHLPWLVVLLAIGLMAGPMLLTVILGLLDVLRERRQLADGAAAEQAKNR